MSDASQRRGYLDWMRGLAVLIMIEAHTLDSWTRVDAREVPAFRWLMIVAGFGAPLFLFLAGVTVALSAGSKLRRTGDVSTASTAVVRRGLWVFVLAFLFRVQSWVLGMGSPKSLLKVDILNIMGPSIAAAAALWGAFRTPRARVVAFAATTLAIGLLTPIVRVTPLLDPLPDPLEAYIRPIRGLTSFCIFPWAGFLFAGGLAGVLLDGVRDRDVETRLHGAALRGRRGAGARRLRGLVSPQPIRAVGVLGQLTGVLPAARRHCHRGAGSRLCVERTPAHFPGLEPAPAARPFLAVHLLDPRGDGVRADLAAASQEPELRGGLRRAGGLRGLHAALLHRQGARRRLVVGEDAPF